MLYRRLTILLAICPFLLRAACPAGAPVGNLRVAVQPKGGGVALPLNTVNRLEPGQLLVYTPPQPLTEEIKKAQVAVVLVPSDQQELRVLEPQPASKPATWTLPTSATIVSLVWGPQGLDKGKIQSFVTKDRDLVAQLADYAEKTAQTETLLTALAQSNQHYDSTENVNAALLGFANQYGAIGKLDRTASTDQQTLTLLRGMNPALATYDPLASEAKVRLQQSAGLAASVAGMFFGNTVGLAASGAALFVNLRTIVFPRLEFRSAYAQPVNREQVSLCGKREPSASRTKLAYLWAVRVPDALAPKLALPTPVHALAGQKTPAPLAVTAGDWKLAERVQDWRLVAPDGQAKPVIVRANREARALELDLSTAPPPAGAYQLAGNWDWTPLPVVGTVQVHALPALQSARLTPEAQDRLFAGAGKVPVEVEGEDFEFTEKVALLAKMDRFPAPIPLSFRLPGGARAGVQRRLESEIDTRTLPAGDYALLLTQQGGATAELPLKVLPPAPQLQNVPLRLNAGDKQQRIVLRGADLARIQQIQCEAAEFTLGSANGPTERDALVKLTAEAKQGEKYALRLVVKDMARPVLLANALEVTGPRPRLSNIQASLATDLGAALKPGELPANSFATFSLHVQHASPGAGITLNCTDPSLTLQTLTVKPGDQTAFARLRASSPGSLFLSFDPGAVGQTGCMVQAAVENGDPKSLGRVIRLPRIEKFELTEEKLGDGLYAGQLSGQDLETIDRVGWDAEHGLKIEGLPVPVAGESQKQTLKVPLTWPSPSPHAPLYIWLRGEVEGRLTTTRP